MSNSKDYRQELKSFIESGRSNDLRKIAHATYAIKTSDIFGSEVYGIQYHKTVLFGIREDGEYFFNNGGHFTVTTKKRINDALAKCRFPYYISQKSFVWFILDRKIESGQMLFDVNNDMQDFANLDCWAKPLSEVSNRNSRVGKYYLTKD